MLVGLRRVGQVAGGDGQHALARHVDADGLLAQLPVPVLEVERVGRADEVVAQAEGVADLVLGDRAVGLAAQPVVHVAASQRPGLVGGAGQGHRALRRPVGQVAGVGRVVLGLLALGDAHVVLVGVAVLVEAAQRRVDGLLLGLAGLFQRVAADEHVARHLAVEGAVAVELGQEAGVAGQAAHGHPHLRQVDELVFEGRGLRQHGLDDGAAIVSALRQRALHLPLVHQVGQLALHRAEARQGARGVAGEALLARPGAGERAPRVGGVEVREDVALDVLAGHQVFQADVAVEHVHRLHAGAGPGVEAQAVDVGGGLHHLAGLRVHRGGAQAQQAPGVLLDPGHDVVAEVTQARVGAGGPAGLGGALGHRRLAQVEHLGHVGDLEPAGHGDGAAVGVVPRVLDGGVLVHSGGLGVAHRGGGPQGLGRVGREVIDDGFELALLDGDGGDGGLPRRVDAEDLRLGPDVVAHREHLLARVRVPVVAAVRVGLVAEEAELGHQQIAVRQGLVVGHVGLVDAPHRGAHLDDRRLAVAGGVEQAVGDLAVARVVDGARVLNGLRGPVEVGQLAPGVAVQDHRLVVGRLVLLGDVVEERAAAADAAAQAVVQRAGAVGVVVGQHVGPPVHAHELALVPGPVGGVLFQHVALLAGGAVVLTLAIEVALDAPGEQRVAPVRLAVAVDDVAHRGLLAVDHGVGAGRDLIGPVGDQQVLLNLEAHLLELAAVADDRRRARGAGGVDHRLLDVPGALGEVGLGEVIGLGAVDERRLPAGGRQQRRASEGEGAQQRRSRGGRHDQKAFPKME